MASTPGEGVPLHSPRDDRSPFFITGAPEFERSQNAANTDAKSSAAGLANLAHQVNEEVKRRLAPQQYGMRPLKLLQVGGHKLKVDGINQSGSVVLSVRLADDGTCEPWTDVIADDVAASNEQEAIDAAHKGPGTHEFLSQHLPDVYHNPVSAINTATTTSIPLKSPLAGVSQPHTPVAVTPTAVSPRSSYHSLVTPPWSATQSQHLPPVIFERHGSHSAASAAGLSEIRTPTRAGSAYSQYSLAQAAQQAESGRVAVEQLVSKAISAAKVTHHEAQESPQVTAAGGEGETAEQTKEREGHGPFFGVPLEPISGAYCIAIMVVGTRGDVQPFLAVARELRRYGHRVRLATHAPYREFVEQHGVEFYPLGGDPTILSEFVVRNRGILPGGGSKGLMKDIREQEEQLKQIVWSTWPACTKPDPQRPSRPFRATAIIANPPSVSHVCCAEALQVPLHVMFTMPWSPTKAFPHPMAVVQSINVAGAISSLPNDFISGAANYYSYRALDLFLWMGFAALLHDFRKHLDLPPYPMTTSGPAHALAGLRVPFTYLWSPALQPKPADWGSHIDVTGFVFLDEDAANFTPSPELAAFLNPRYDAPIYIGFGSLVLTDPKATTEIIYEAARVSGKRVILSRGWAGLGGGGAHKPDNVFVVSDCPHSWLFGRCSAAVHHGGAGTTAAALRAGLPTLVVPFFGDQPFWGERCVAAGVGPRAVPIGRLCVNDLVAAFAAFDSPEVRERAQHVAACMAKENGCSSAVEHFHRCLDQHRTNIPPGAYRAPRPPYEDVSMSTLASLRSNSYTRMSVDISSAAIDAVTIEMKRSMKISASAIQVSKSTAKQLSAAVHTLVPTASIGSARKDQKDRRASRKSDSMDEKRGSKRRSFGSFGMGRHGSEAGGGAGAGSQTTNDHATAVKWAKGGSADSIPPGGGRPWWSFLTCGACLASQDVDTVDPPNTPPPAPPVTTTADAQCQTTRDMHVQTPTPLPHASEHASVHPHPVPANPPTTPALDPLQGRAEVQHVEALPLSITPLLGSPNAPKQLSSSKPADAQSEPSANEGSSQEDSKVLDPKQATVSATTNNSPMPTFQETAASRTFSDASPHVMHAVHGPCSKSEVKNRLHALKTSNAVPNTGSAESADNLKEDLSRVPAGRHADGQVSVSISSPRYSDHPDHPRTENTANSLNTLGRQSAGDRSAVRPVNGVCTSRVQDSNSKVSGVVSLGQSEQRAISLSTPKLQQIDDRPDAASSGPLLQPMAPKVDLSS